MDHKLCKDCKGYCCDDFAVFVSPDQLEISYHHWLSGHKSDKTSKRIMNGFGGDQDLLKYQGIHLTYPMLIFTHKDNIHPDGNVVCKGTVYHYRCKHHNQKTKMCDIHEIRPMVCRTFPDMDFCGYKKVKIKEVVEDRPKWFEFGLDIDDWFALRDGNDTKEDIIIKKLDNINSMLEGFNGDEHVKADCPRQISE